jgi:phosphatidate cytidylyltransferase
MKRILTAAVALPILLYTVWSTSPYPFVMLAAIAIEIALHEFYGLADAIGQSPIRVPGYAAALAIAGCFAIHKTDLIAAVLILLALVAFTTRVLQAAKLRTSFVAVSSTILGVAYVALLGSCLIGVKVGDTPSVGPAQSAKLLTMFFAMVILTDTGAYYTGRSIGRHKLAPLISPGKTIEGSVGGFVAAVAAGPLSRQIFFPDIPLVDSLVLGALIGVIGQMGDLAESMLKRNAGVKDSGTLLPGHGGMLDRIDSILFCAPILFYYSKYFLPKN